MTAFLKICEVIILGTYWVKIENILENILLQLICFFLLFKKGSF